MLSVCPTEPMGDKAGWSAQCDGHEDMGVIVGLDPIDAGALQQLIDEQLNPRVNETPHVGSSEVLVEKSQPKSSADPTSPAVLHQQPSPSLAAAASESAEHLPSGIFSADPSIFDFEMLAQLGGSTGAGPLDFSALETKCVAEVAAPPPVDLYDPVSILPRIAFSSEELKLGDAIDLEKEFEAFAVAEQTALRRSTGRHSDGDGTATTETAHPMYAARRSALQLAYEYPMPLPPADAAAARRRALLKRTDPIRAHHIEQVLDAGEKSAVAACSLREQYARLVLDGLTDEEREYHEVLQRKLQRQTAKIERLRAAVATERRAESSGGVGRSDSSSPPRNFATNADAELSLRTRTGLASRSREHVQTMDVTWSAFMIDLERRGGKLEPRHLDAYFPK